MGLMMHITGVRRCPPFHTTYTVSLPPEKSPLKMSAAKSKDYGVLYECRTCTVHCALVVFVSTPGGSATHAAAPVVDSRLITSHSSDVGPLPISRPQGSRWKEISPYMMGVAGRLEAIASRLEAFTTS